MRPTPTSPTLNEDDFVDSIAEGDYIFVVDAKGNLKSVLLPEESTMETPERVQRVMNVFGITEFDNETVH